MDELELTVLRAGMADDARVFADAVRTAGERLRSRSPTETESCAYHLACAYNVIEQLAARVARAFENHIDDRAGGHAGLLRRMSLDVPGVRPALFAAGALDDLHDLRGFRHVVHHAYDTRLRPDRVALALAGAERVAADLPAWVDRFVAAVAELEGWTRPN